MFTDIPRMTCVSQGVYDASDYHFFNDSQTHAVPPHACAKACDDELAPNCTGYTTSRLRADAGTDVGCFLWFNGACSAPDAPGAYTVSADAPVDIITYVRCGGPSPPPPADAASAITAPHVVECAWASPSPPPYPPAPPMPPAPPSSPPRPPPPPYPPPYPPFGPVVHARDAEELLAAAASRGVRRITLDAGGVYLLPRELVIAGTASAPRNLDISCAGTATLRSAAGAARNDSRVVRVSDASVLLQGLALEGGWVKSLRGGGGLLVDGAAAHVRMRRCSVRGNGAALGSGGGIDVYHGTLEMDECIVANNTASSGAGLTLYYSPRVVLARTDVLENTATGGDGGGIFCWATRLELLGASVTHNRVTEPVYSNFAGGGGGGIMNYGGNITSNGSVLAHNSASVRGGGLLNLILINNITGSSFRRARALLVDTTLQRNSAPSGAGVFNQGGAFECSGATMCTLGSEIALFGEGSVVEGNNASAADGAAFENYGTAYLGRGARLARNVGAYEMHNDANLTYVLPTPPGTYYTAAVACEWQMCTNLSAQLNTINKIRCPHQSCDVPGLEDVLASTGIEGGALGQRIVSVPQLSLPSGTSVPLLCGSPSYYCPGDAGGDAEGAGAFSGAHRVQQGYMSVGAAGLGSACTDECVAEEPCSPGYWCSAGKRIACPTGTYTSSSAAPRSSAQACTPCPLRSTTVQAASSSLDGCVALPGFFKQNATEFLPCFDGTRCGDRPATTMPSLALEATFWRPGYLATSASACPHAAACVGGAMSATPSYNRFSDETCAPGRGLAGAYCQLCLDETHYFSEETVSCHACEAWTTALVVLLLVVSASAVAWCWSACATRMGRLVARLALRSKLKICIGFYQIITQLGRVYVVTFPPAYEAILRFFRIANLHMFDWIPAMAPRCLGLPSLVEQLLFATLAPVVLALVAVVVAVARRTSPCATALPLILYGSFIVFPPIASLGFRALAECDCFQYAQPGAVDGDGGSEICFLRADYAETCTLRLAGRLYPRMPVVAVAWLAVALFACGVPLLFAAVICGRGQLALRAAASFLTDAYVPGAVYWELVEVAKKLLLTGWLALVRPGTLPQIYLGVTVSRVVLVLQLQLRPYRNPADNLLAMASEVALAFTLLGTLAFSTDERGDSRACTAASPADEIVENSMIMTLLVAAALIVVLIATAFVAAEIRAVRAAPYARWKSDGSFVTPRHLPVAGRYHAFISHVRASGRDQACAIQSQLGALVPGFRACIDTDELPSRGSTCSREACVEASDAVVVFLSGSLHGTSQASDYFRSGPALQEFRCAVASGKRVVLVLETDPHRGGVAYEAHREACPDELLPSLKAMPVVRWHRKRDFQLASLRVLLRALFCERPLDAIVFRQPRLRPRPCSLFVSAHNSGAAEVAGLVADATGDDGSIARVDRLERADCALLVVDGAGSGQDMRDNDALYDELEAALLHADGCAWVRVGRSLPPGARMLEHVALGEVLAARATSAAGEEGVIRFSAAEWGVFQMANLRSDHCVRSSGGVYFQPARREQDARPRLLVVYDCRKGGAANAPRAFVPGDGEGGELGTPAALLELGVAADAVVPLYDGELGEASVRLMLRALYRGSSVARRPYSRLLESELGAAFSIHWKKAWSAVVRRMTRAGRAQVEGRDGLIEFAP